MAEDVAGRTGVVGTPTTASRWPGGRLLRRLSKCVRDVNVLEIMGASRSVGEGSYK